MACVHIHTRHAVGSCVHVFMSVCALPREPPPIHLHTDARSPRTLLLQVSRIVAGSREGLEAMYLPLISPSHSRPSQQSASTVGSSSNSGHSSSSSSHSPQPATGAGSGGGSCHSTQSANSSNNSSGSSSGSVLIPGALAGVEGVGEPGVWRQAGEEESQVALVRMLPPALLGKVSWRVCACMQCSACGGACVWGRGTGGRRG